MLRIEIKNRFTGKLIFEYSKENNTIKETVLEAIKSYADLSYADLSSADLSSANLRSADLRSANLSSADLSYADLSYANLRSANLSYADLRSADLSSIKNDLWAVLLTSKNEIKGLKDALINGIVDGSTYTGECCCLVGTIANVCSINYEKLPILKPNSQRPAERWFLGIKKGDNPENSQICKITMDWINEFEMLLNI